MMLKTCIFILSSLFISESFAQYAKQANSPITGPDEVCYTRSYEYAIHLRADSIIWQPQKGNMEIIGSNTDREVVVEIKDTGLLVLQAMVYNQGDKEVFTKKLHTFQVSEAIAGDTRPTASSTENYEMLYKEADYYDWSVRPGYAGSVFKGNGTHSVDVAWNEMSRDTKVQLVCNLHKCGYNQYIGLPVVIQKAVGESTPNNTFILITQSRKQKDTVGRRATILCGSKSYSLAIAGDSIQAYNVIYSFYVDNQLLYTGFNARYKVDSIIAGNHILKETISYAGGKKQLIIIKIVDIELQEIPVASFKTSAEYVCENQPVFFTNTSQHFIKNIWQFGDGSSSTLKNVAKLYKMSIINPECSVELSVTNERGCKSDTMKVVNIISNYLGGFIRSDSLINTRGKVVKLQYYKSVSGGILDNITWMRDNETLANGNKEFINVDKTGIYWIKLENNHGCFKPIFSEPIIFVHQKK